MLTFEFDVLNSKSDYLAIDDDDAISQLSHGDAILQVKLFSDNNTADERTALFAAMQQLIDKLKANKVATKVIINASIPHLQHDIDAINSVFADLTQQMKSSDLNEASLTSDRLGLILDRSLNPNTIKKIRSKLQRVNTNKTRKITLQRTTQQQQKQASASKRKFLEVSIDVSQLDPIEAVQADAHEKYYSRDTVHELYDYAVSKHGNSDVDLLQIWDRLVGENARKIPDGQLRKIELVSESAMKLVIDHYKEFQFSLNLENIPVEFCLQKSDTSQLILARKKSLVLEQSKHPLTIKLTNEIKPSIRQIALAIDDPLVLSDAPEAFSDNARSIYDDIYRPEVTSQTASQALDKFLALTSKGNEVEAKIDEKLKAYMTAIGLTDPAHYQAVTATILSVGKAHSLYALNALFELNQLPNNYMYQDFKRIFIDDATSFAGLSHEDTTTNIKILTSLTGTQYQWWVQMVSKQKELGAHIDFNDLMNAFKFFIEETVKLGVTEWPLLSPFENSRNMKVCLDRSLYLVTRAAAANKAQDQFYELSGVDLSAEGAVYALRYYPYLFATDKMGFRVNPEENLIDYSLPTRFYASTLLTGSKETSMELFASMARGTSFDTTVKNFYRWVSLKNGYLHYGAYELIVEAIRQIDIQAEVSDSVKEMIQNQLLYIASILLIKHSAHHQDVDDAYDFLEFITILVSEANRVNSPDIAEKDAKKMSLSGVMNVIESMVALVNVPINERPTVMQLSAIYLELLDQCGSFKAAAIFDDVMQVYKYAGYQTIELFKNVRLISDKQKQIERAAQESGQTSNPIDIYTYYFQSIFYEVIHNKRNAFFPNIEYDQTSNEYNYSFPEYLKLLTVLNNKYFNLELLKESLNLAATINGIFEHSKEVKTPEIGSYLRHIMHLLSNVDITLSNEGIQIMGLLRSLRSYGNTNRLGRTKKVKAMLKLPTHNDALDFITLDMRDTFNQVRFDTGMIKPMEKDPIGLIKEYSVMLNFAKWVNTLPENLGKAPIPGLLSLYNKTEFDSILHRFIDTLAKKEIDLNEILKIIADFDIELKRVLNSSVLGLLAKPVIKSILFFARKMIAKQALPLFKPKLLAVIDAAQENLDLVSILKVVSDQFTYNYVEYLFNQLHVHDQRILALFEQYLKPIDSKMKLDQVAFHYNERLINARDFSNALVNIHNRLLHDPKLFVTFIETFSNFADTVPFLKHKDIIEAISKIDNIDLTSTLALIYSQISLLPTVNESQINTIIRTSQQFSHYSSQFDITTAKPILRAAIIYSLNNNDQFPYTTLIALSHINNLFPTIEEAVAKGLFKNTLDILLEDTTKINEFVTCLNMTMALLKKVSNHKIVASFIYRLHSQYQQASAFSLNEFIQLLSDIEHHADAANIVTALANATLGINGNIIATLTIQDILDFKTLLFKLHDADRTQYNRIIALFRNKPCPDAATILRISREGHFEQYLTDYQLDPAGKRLNAADFAMQANFLHAHRIMNQTENLYQYETLEANDKMHLSREFTYVNSFCRTYPVKLQSFPEKPLSRYTIDELKKLTLHLANSIRKSSQVNDKNRLAATSSLEIRLLYLAVIREAYYKINGLHPYSTQISAALHAINANGQNLLLQINTGEGKTITSLLLAIMKWTEGNTVDIGTSTLDLARAGHHEAAALFEFMGINSAYVTAGSDSGTYQVGGINFSRPSDLSRYKQVAKIMGEDLNHLNGKKIPALLINDEGDKTLLDDKSDNNLALSIRLEDGKNPYEWLFIIVNEFIDLKQLTLLNDINEVRYNDDDINELERLIATKVTAEQAQLYQKIINPKEFLYLCIDSAITAKDLKLEHHYIMDEGDELDGKIRVTLVPTDDTIPQRGSTFSDFIQYHLEARLQTAENAKPNPRFVFPMNPYEKSVNTESPERFVRSYDQSGGVIFITGTGGSKEELAEIKARYQCVAISIPPYNPSRKETLDSMYTENEAAHFKSVEEAIIGRKKSLNSETGVESEQPVLVITKNIEMAKKLKMYIFNENHINAENLMLITGEETEAERDKYIELAGNDNKITFSTPIMTRGIDVKATHEAKLYVILTYLPSYREMIQALGRAARNGQVGFVRIILNNNDIVVNHDIDLTNLSDEECKAKIKEIHRKMDKESAVERFYKNDVDQMKGVIIKHLDRWQKYLKSALPENTPDLQSDLLDYRNQLIFNLDISWKRRLDESDPNQDYSDNRYVRWVDGKLDRADLDESIINYESSILTIWKEIESKIIAKIPPHLKRAVDIDKLLNSNDEKAVNDALPQLQYLYLKQIDIKEELKNRHKDSQYATEIERDQFTFNSIDVRLALNPARARMQIEESLSNEDSHHLFMESMRYDFILILDELKVFIKQYAIESNELAPLDAMAWDEIINNQTLSANDLAMKMLHFATIINAKCHTDFRYEFALVSEKIVHVINQYKPFLDENEDFTLFVSKLENPTYIINDHIKERLSILNQSFAWCGKSGLINAIKRLIMGKTAVSSFINVTDAINRYTNAPPKDETAAFSNLLMMLNANKTHTQSFRWFFAKEREAITAASALMHNTATKFKESKPEYQRVLDDISRNNVITALVNELNSTNHNDNRANAYHDLLLSSLNAPHTPMTLGHCYYRIAYELKNTKKNNDNEAYIAYLTEQQKIVNKHALLSDNNYFETLNQRENITALKKSIKQGISAKYAITESQIHFIANHDGERAFNEIRIDNVSAENIENLTTDGYTVRNKKDSTLFVAEFTAQLARLNIQKGLLSEKLNTIINTKNNLLLDISDHKAIGRITNKPALEPLINRYNANLEFIKKLNIDSIVHNVEQSKRSAKLQIDDSWPLDIKIAARSINVLIDSGLESNKTLNKFAASLSFTKTQAQKPLKQAIFEVLVNLNKEASKELQAALRVTFDQDMIIINNKLNHVSNMTNYLEKRIKKMKSKEKVSPVKQLKTQEELYFYQFEIGADTNIKPVNRDSFTSKSIFNQDQPQEQINGGASPNPDRKLV